MVLIVATVAAIIPELPPVGIAATGFNEEDFDEVAVRTLEQLVSTSIEPAAITIATGSVKQLS